jgi:pimeloyl-ACP methyl ester carboxylesterase
MLFTFGATALAISGAKCPGFVKQKRTGHNTRLLYLRHLRIFVAALAVAMFVAGCGTPDGSANNGEPQKSETIREEVSVGDTEAIVWGEGDRGVVLSHGASYDAASWEPQGRTLAENGVAALAVEDTSPGNLQAAIEYLKVEHNVESVALIGASAGARPVLQVAREAPEEISQIILLSGVGDVSGLKEHPKLFVASEGEGIAEQVRRMTKEAPGDLNEALILPGDAHSQALFQTEGGERLMRAILERLEEYG